MLSTEAVYAQMTVVDKRETRLERGIKMYPVYTRLPELMPDPNQALKRIKYSAGINPLKQLNQILNFQIK